ncbi:MAG TPA: SDR family oxidoreductase, partial [Bacillota bacterium]
MSFDGRVVVVTGGAGRIGRGICRRFAEEGAFVAVVDRDGDGAAALAREIAGSEGTARGFTVDVSEEPAVEQLVSDVAAWRGPVHVLVNGAAVFPYAPLLEISTGDWDQAFRVNVRGPMLLTRAVARQMIAHRIRGSVINLTSYSGQSARADAGAYASSKAALNLLTRTFAIELGPYGIRVNAVSPGLVRDEVLGPDNPPRNEYDRAV